MPGQASKQYAVKKKTERSLFSNKLKQWDELYEKTKINGSIHGKVNETYCS